jgi:hypothetical protein
MHAGCEIRLRNPLLPDAITDAMSFDLRLPIARSMSGITPSQGAVNALPPKLIFADAIA